MASLLLNLKKQLSFHQLDSRSTASVELEGVDLDFSLNHDEDEEQDGFLLVGEKMSKQLSNKDPSGLPGSTATGQADPGHQPIWLAPQPGLYSVSAAPCLAVPATPVGDVPMDLHPSIKTQSQIESIFDQVSLEPKTFNWARYSYDFSYEQTYLRDVECKNEYSSS